MDGLKVKLVDPIYREASMTHSRRKRDKFTATWPESVDFAHATTFTRYRLSQRKDL